MPEIITYSLRSNQDNSDEYFSIISAFCGEVIECVSKEMNEVFKEYETWIIGKHLLREFKVEENIYIILNIGILLKIYGSKAMESGRTTEKILSWLVTIRETNAVLKPMADLTRGILSGITNFNDRKRSEYSVITLDNLNRLLDWLQASGEFDEVIKKLQGWEDFLASRGSSDVEAFFSKITDLSDWFEARSLARLGRYTENVNQFLKEKHPHYRWREDSLFTGRSRVEYHLNMLGTELMNQMLREDFKKSSQKIVILPPCMKAKADDECLARQTALGEECMHCTPGCRVNQVSKLGEKYGFLVRIIPDDLKIYSGDTSVGGDFKSVGIVGVSCPLTNAQGGLEMIRMGVPAQGLPLDYCGCSYHWHKDRIPTDINFKKLISIIE